MTGDGCVAHDAGEAHACSILIDRVCSEFVESDVRDPGRRHCGGFPQLACKYAGARTLAYWRTTVTPADSTKIKTAGNIAGTSLSRSC